MMCLTGLAHGQEPYDTMWSVSYNASADQDVVYDIAVDFTGNYVAVGFTETGNYMHYILKLDATTGDTLWSRTYWGVNEDELHAVKIAPDGNYAVAGNVYTDTSSTLVSQAYAAFIDSSSGNILQMWANNLTVNNSFNALALDSEGRLLLTGYVESDSGDRDLLVMKIDLKGGGVIWSRVYGGSQDDEGMGVVMSPGDSFCIVVGYTWSFSSGYDDVWLLKLDAQTGDTIWSRTYGTYMGETGYAVDVAPDGNYVVAAKSFQTTDDIWVMAVEQDNGDVIWSRTFDTGNQERPYSMVAGSDNRIYLAGGSSTNGNDGFVMVLDSAGDSLWMNYYGTASYDKLLSITLDGEGHILAGGTYDFSTGGGGAWIVKLYGYPAVDSPEDGDPFPVKVIRGGIVLGPIHGGRVKVQVVDISGRVIRSASISNGKEVIHLPCGIYTLVLYGSDGTTVRKVMVIR